MKPKRFCNLRYDSIAPLLRCNDEAILTFARRDLLDQDVAVENLWQAAEPQKVIRRQQSNGCWIYPGGNDRIRTKENYNQIETYRNLGILVEQYGFNRNHPAIQKAAEYLTLFQSPQGDFRGIYGDQYTPNYSAGITELLIKAGYANDARIEKLFEWLLSNRQNDGGWAIALRTRNCSLDLIAPHAKTIEPDVTKPFSAMVTGVVLRAFAAHPKRRQSLEARRAGTLLLSSLFKKDHYPDRGSPEYWLRFCFPFWFTDLISALDSLSLLGFSKEEPQIKRSLDWFTASQKNTGLWKLKILKGRNKDIIECWLALAVCRSFKRFYS
jgi:hypothetical protein